MTKINISIVVFSVMLLFPVLFSLFFLHKKNSKVLEVDQAKLKDPRYFVKSFTKLFDQKWTNYDGSGKIILSQKENILQADGLEEYPPVCSSIVYAENLEFKPQPGTRFEKEVYVRQNSYLSGIESIRAICSKKDLVLGSGTHVLRWADAEGTLTAFDNCDLGISTSSTTKIIVGRNCCFRRLYAPVILFGQAPGEELPLNDQSQNVKLEPNALKRFWNIKYVSDELTDDSGVFTGSIITSHDIIVLNRLTVKGHIRSHKNIRLCDQAVVYGNLFAEGDIYLGQNARVYGLIFAQGSLYAESGAVVGQPGKTKSIIVRKNIIFNGNCRVYGYVSSEAGGKCCPDSSLDKADTVILPVLSHPRLYENYILKQLLTAVLSTAVLLTIITTGISATGILQKVQEKEKLPEEQQEVANEPAYRADGKQDGGQLEAEPTLVTEDYIYFEDRVLERFHCNAESVIQCSEDIIDVMASLPEGVNKYLMYVPMRISLENEKYQIYSDDVSGAIDELYNKIPPEVTTLDAAGALLQHKDEYLFFRTDSAWTALGAYYAAKEFCKSTGIIMKDISEYRENQYQRYFGTLRALPHAQSLRNYPDYVSYYILEGAANEQTITTRRSKDEYVTYKAPTVALSRLGHDIFIGAVFSHSILRGDAKNSNTLFILGDKYGKILAPWLTPYYENVVLVDPKYFIGKSKEFRELFSEYPATDFLIVDCAQNITDRSISKRIREICSKR